MFKFVSKKDWENFSKMYFDMEDKSRVCKINDAIIKEQLFDSDKKIAELNKRISELESIINLNEKKFEELNQVIQKKNKLIGELKEKYREENIELKIKYDYENSVKENYWIKQNQLLKNQIKSLDSLLLDKTKSVINIQNRFRKYVERIQEKVEDNEVIALGSSEKSISPIEKSSNGSFNFDSYKGEYF